MEKLRRLAAFWPGFAGLWNGGTPTCLVLALLFALSVNSAILCSFVWTEFGSVELQVTLWVASCLCFGFAATYSFISSRGQASLRESARDLFLRAQREYLGGDWSEAEKLLGQIVKRQPGDVEARLFLATIHRHTNRLNEARDQLHRLSKLTRSAAWSMEIAREWQQLSRQATEASDNDIDVRQPEQTSERARAA